MTHEAIYALTDMIEGAQESLAVPVEWHWTYNQRGDLVKEARRLGLSLSYDDHENGRGVSISMTNEYESRHLCFCDRQRRVYFLQFAVDRNLTTKKHIWLDGDYGLWWATLQDIAAAR